MGWRNDQMDILRQNTLLTPERQETYYHETLLPSYDEKFPKQILFSILLDDKCIGYGGLVHIDWKIKQAEVSFLLETSRKEGTPSYGSDFKAFLHVIKKVAFEDLQFVSLITETYDVRPSHLAALESEGFVEEKRTPKAVEIKGKRVDAIFHKCRQ